MILALQIGNSPFQPLIQIVTLDWVAGGGFFIAKHALVKHHLAQHHFRVVDKIGVQRDTILIFLNGNPWAVVLVRHDFPFPLLQEQ